MKLFCRRYHIRYAVAFLLFLSFSTTCIYGETGSLINSEPKEALKYLLARLESNLEQFGSGEGKVSWEMIGVTADYFEIPAGAGKQMSIDFAFSEDKLRWDAHTRHLRGGEQLKSYLHRGVLNSPVEYEATKSINLTENNIENVHELKPTDLYIWKSGKSKSSIYSGGRVDLKYMMQPFGFPLEVVRQVLFDGDTSEIDMRVLDVSSSSDNLITVKLEASKNNSAIEKHLTFDVSKGHNIVKEAMFQEGQLASQVIRTFRSYGKGWFLDSLEHSLYHLSVDGTPTGKSIFKVEEFEPNKSISENTFEICGMGLAKGAEIHDMVGGLKFKLDVEELLDESIEKLSYYMVTKNNNNDNLKSKSEKQRIATVTDQEISPVGSEQEDQKESIEKQNNPNSKLGTLFAILTVVLLILALSLRKLFHRR